MAHLRLLNPRKPSPLWKTSPKLPRKSSSSANAFTATPGRSLGDKMQMLAFVRPQALPIIELIVDQLLTDENEKLTNSGE